MDPQQAQTAKTFDSYKDRYDSTVDAAVAFTGLPAGFFTQVKAGYIMDIVNAHHGGGALSALDIGCGIGSYHGLLKQRFAHLAGVDISGDCLETARSRHPDVDYRSYDGGVLPYPDASFDVAFTICVIHHVPRAHWNVFAAEMRRILKPGGLALVFEHNPRNPLTMRAVNSCPFDADAVLLRAEDAERLMQRAGFRDVQSRFILTIPAANGVLRRLDRLFARLPLGGQYYVTATA